MSSVIFPQPWLHSSATRFSNPEKLNAGNGKNGNIADSDKQFLPAEHCALGISGTLTIVTDVSATSGMVRFPRSWWHTCFYFFTEPGDLVFDPMALLEGALFYF